MYYVPVFGGYLVLNQNLNIKIRTGPGSKKKKKRGWSSPHAEFDPLYG
jgi:hypothetical protein